MTNCSLSKIILEHMDINKERDDRKREEKEEQEEEFDSEEEVKSSNKFVSSHFSLSDTAEKYAEFTVFQSCLIVFLSLPYEPK